MRLQVALSVNYIIGSYFIWGVNFPTKSASYRPTSPGLGWRWQIEMWWYYKRINVRGVSFTRYNFLYNQNNFSPFYIYKINPNRFIIEIGLDLFSFEMRLVILAPILVHILCLMDYWARAKPFKYSIQAEMILTFINDIDLGDIFKARIRKCPW